MTLEDTPMRTCVRGTQMTRHPRSAEKVRKPAQTLIEVSVPCAIRRRSCRARTRACRSRIARPGKLAHGHGVETGVGDELARDLHGLRIVGRERDAESFRLAERVALEG